MIDSLPIARLLFQFEWERSQWDSECERDIATNASRDLPCKFLSPSGVTPSMYALHCNDCSWTYPSPPTRTMSSRGGPGRTSYSKGQPHRTMSMGPSLSLLSREAASHIRVVATRVKAQAQSTRVLF